MQRQYPPEQVFDIQGGQMATLRSRQSTLLRFFRFPYWIRRLGVYRGDRAGRARSIVMMLMCVSFAFANSAAQVDPYYAFDGNLIGSAESDGLHLHIQFDENPWCMNYWQVTPAGIDVYRKEVGYRCGKWERLTNEPVAWNWVADPEGGPPMVFELVDAAAQSNHAYMYQARAVDANRMAIAEDLDAYLGVATVGIALLGHGTLYAGPGGCGLSYVEGVNECAQECFPPCSLDSGPDVDPYLNSETPVLLYGVVEDVIYTCGTNETVLYISSAVPSACIVGVEERTWGEVKSLYR
jgi:hypothetical protein